MNEFCEVENSFFPIDSTDCFHAAEVTGHYGSLQLQRGFVFALVKKGTARATDASGCTDIAGGDFVVLTPSMSVTVDCMSGDFGMTCVFLLPEYYDSLHDAQPMYAQVVEYLRTGRLPLLHLDSGEREVMQQILSLFLQYGSEDDIYRDGILRNLSGLCLLQTAALFRRRNSRASAGVRRSSDVYRMFRKLLSENYREHHDISFYAGRLNISPTYLSRIVKLVTGRTVHFHVSEYVCAEARRMLEFTEADVKEVAEVLGFADQSSFGKFFFRMTGMSPLRFRNVKRGAGHGA